MNSTDIYQPIDQQIGIEVHFENETVWLTQEQMGILFQCDASVITRHIRNIFKEGELEDKGTMQKMAVDGSDKHVPFYNLDVIISVGYRVSVKCGTHFRHWAIHRLKEYLVEDYAINQMTIV